jgi:3-hydroxyisobutyrate dehydrogenase-like beta-hydroxyacid dehydrogenase
VSIGKSDCSDGEGMSKDNVTVGFVGLGTMGGRMAANVQRAGFKLIVHDLHRQSASHHLADGAVWAASPAALARQADVIFSSLPEPSDVEAVALGPDGLIAGIKPGAAYFDLSTNSPSVVKKLNAAFAEKGAHMLDAPVSGGPAGAASRKLAIWVGGDESAFKEHKALLDAIGDKAAYIGPPWPSSSTTCRAMQSFVRSRKRSPWGSRRASSRSRCGRRCAKARLGVVLHSTL